MRIFKYSAIAVLFLLVPLILAPTFNFASAQDEQEPPFPIFPPTEEQAQVILTTTVGGTTEPVPGQYTYPNNTKFEIKAVQDTGYRFAYWSISGEFLPGHNLPLVIIPLDPTGNIDYIPDIQWQAVQTQLY